MSIEATKEGVKFSCQGDIGNGSVSLRNHTNVEKPETDVSIELTEPVALTFSLKYLVSFCKASGLSSSVKISLHNEVPLLVEYELASNSYLRFYLAPKVSTHWHLYVSSLLNNGHLDRRGGVNQASGVREVFEWEGCEQIVVWLKAGFAF